MKSTIDGNEVIGELGARNVCLAFALGRIAAIADDLEKLSGPALEFRGEAGAFFCQGNLARLADGFKRIQDIGLRAVGARGLHDVMRAADGREAGNAGVGVGDDGSASGEDGTPTAAGAPGGGRPAAPAGGAGGVDGRTGQGPGDPVPAG